MAHKKAGGSKARQQTRTIGKRLGLKAAAGQTIGAGTIVLRQRGMEIAPGDGVKMGRDFTVFAIKEGKVKFFKKLGKTFVSVE